MSKTPTTLFIDLNTHRIRAGINNHTLLDTPNTINKKPPSFNTKYIKNQNSIFLNNFPIISNLTNLEFSMDLILDHLKLTNLKTYDLILTVNPFLPKYFEENLVKFLFQLYGFRRIQLGITSFYSLSRFVTASENERFKDSLIINCGFSSTYVLFNGERFYLPVGQSLFLDMLYKICALKFRSPYTKKNYDYNLISQYLRVSLDYERESLELVNMLYEDPTESEVNINISDMVVQQNRSDHLKDFHRKRSESTSNKTSSHKGETLSSDKGNEGQEEDDSDDSISENASFKTNDSISSIHKEEKHETLEDSEKQEIIEEKEESENEEEQQKRLKREALAENLIYHSRLYQLKTKISKIINVINSQIIKNKKVYSQKIDPQNYLKNLKNKLNNILEKERDDELFRRDKDIPKLINILNNKDDLNSHEMELLNKINLLNDEELNLTKQTDKENLVKEIREFEPDFVYEKVRLPEILSGEYLNKQLLNIELIRIPECLFNPSIFRMNFVGLKEVFEILYKKSYKIFITGEFILKGMKERVEKEIRECIKGDIKTGEVIVIPWNEKDFKFIKEFPVFEKIEFLKQFD